MCRALTTTGLSDREPDPRQGKARRRAKQGKGVRLSRGRPAHAAGGQARMPHARSFIGWPITRPNLPSLLAVCAAPIFMAARARDPATSHTSVALPTTLQMLPCASALAQGGFARPRQQHRVPLTRCRVARTQVPNRLHPLRRRASSSRSRCIRTLQADRGRVQAARGAKKWGSDSRPRRLIFPVPARTQGPSTRRATTTQGRHRPGARIKPPPLLFVPTV